MAPPGNPDGSPYTSKLTCFSIFGNQRLDTNGNMVPFTAADCPGGTAVFPSASSGLWDATRPSADTTGYIRKLLASEAARQLFRRPRRLESGAVCFSAASRRQHRRTAQQIADPNANSKQINIKIDHNFNASNKAAFNYTYQRDDSDGQCLFLADGPSGSVVRRPHVFTVNVTSTLTPNIVNEARFGLNRNYNSTVPAYLNSTAVPIRPANSFFSMAGRAS